MEQASKLEEAARAYGLGVWHSAIAWADTNEFWSKMLKVGYLATRYEKFMEDFRSSKHKAFNFVSQKPPHATAEIRYGGEGRWENHVIGWAVNDSEFYLPVVNELSAEDPDWEQGTNLEPIEEEK